MMYSNHTCVVVSKDQRWFLGSGGFMKVPRIFSHPQFALKSLRRLINNSKIGKYPAFPDNLTISDFQIRYMMFKENPFKPPIELEKLV